MPTDPRAETLRLLTSIDASLRILVNRAAPPETPAAPIVDLDSAHGNPLVKAKDPRDWSGEPMTGRTFSECPPEYLDLLAARYEHFASTSADPKKKKYDTLDAARARAWAARKRAGWTAPEPTGGFSDEPGF